MIKLYEEITTNLRQLSEADIQDLLNFVLLCYG